MRKFFTVFERRMFQTKLPALINLLRNSERKGNAHRELMRENVSGDAGAREGTRCRVGDVRTLTSTLSRRPTLT